METQKWYQSRTILALIVPALIGVYKSLVLVLSLCGVVLPAIPDGAIDAVINLILAAGTFLAIFFRVKTNKVIE